MNIPTVAFALIVASIVVLILWVLIKVVVYAFSADEETKQNGINHIVDQDMWHREQGHIEERPSAIDMRMGRFSSRWRDNQGNDVTYKSRFN